jgi:hypothetical protein
MDFGKERKIFGRLGSLSLSDIVQLLGVNRKTATLSLEREGQRGEIFLKEGTVVHATVGDVEGEEAILELLDWTDAEFVIDEGLVTLPKSTISRDAEALMLIVANKWDEAHRGSQDEAGEGSLESGPGGGPPKGGADQKERLEWVNRELLSIARQSERRRLTVPLVLILGFGIIIPSAYLYARLFGNGGTSSSTAESAQAVSEPRLPELPESETEEETAPSPAAAMEENAATDDDDGAVDVAEGSEPEPPPAATSAAPALPESHGFLLAVVEPWAEVFVDGRSIGETPMDRVQLPVGEHTLTLSNENFAGVITDTVAIPPDATVTRKYTFNDFGYLQVVVRPWAEVHVDGRFVGQTPLAKLRIPVGRHQVVLRHPELGEKLVVVDIEHGQTNLVRTEM